ncbi:unnamed protein product [Arabidopsis halleri]
MNLLSKKKKKKGVMNLIIFLVNNIFLTSGSRHIDRPEPAT